MVKVFGNLDDAELAARLGSVDTFDRRGNVAWMDDFEAPVSKWSLIGDGLDNEQAITVVHSRMGSQSLMLKAGTTNTQSAEAATIIPYRIDGRIGFEYSWTRGFGMDNMALYLRTFTGAAYVFSGLRFTGATGTLAYYDSAGNFQPIEAGISMAESDYSFTPMKLVIDTDRGYYVRALLSEHEWDLSAHRCRTGAVGTAASIRPTIEYYGGAIAPSPSYIDCAILTINED